MAQTNATQPRRRPSWFSLWIITLASIATLSGICLAGNGVYGLTQRPAQLPEIRLPDVHHDGIYPTATQELTKVIFVTVAKRHRGHFRDAVVAGIEQSGGRVKNYNYNTIEAIAPASYVEELNKLRDRRDGSEHRNSRYIEWTEQLAARNAAGTTREAQGEWTTFTVRILQSITHNRRSAVAMASTLTTTSAALIMIFVSFRMRADLTEQKRRNPQ